MFDGSKFIRKEIDHLTCKEGTVEDGIKENADAYTNHGGN